jgi:hypothetical protein
LKQCRFFHFSPSMDSSISALSIISDDELFAKHFVIFPYLSSRCAIFCPLLVQIFRT